MKQNNNNNKPNDKSWVKKIFGIDSDKKEFQIEDYLSPNSKMVLDKEYDGNFNNLTLQTIVDFCREKEYKPALNILIKYQNELGWAFNEIEAIMDELTIMSEVHPGDLYEFSQKHDEWVMNGEKLIIE